MDPSPFYPAFTATMVLASALCGYHAWRTRQHRVFYGASIVYGLLLEKLVILQFEAYSYPADRMIDALGVPLAIGFGWSSIIYAGFVTARAFGLRDRYVPAFVALYGLHVDLAMDAVAIRVPYWSWSDAGAWFGVPLGNFFGWFVVGFAFPLAYVVLRRRVSHPLVLGVASILGAVALLIAALKGWSQITADVVARRVVLLAITIALAVGYLTTAEFQLRPTPSPTTAVTLLFHGYFLVVLVVLDLHARLPLLLVVSLSMAAIGVGLHVSPDVRSDGTVRAGLPSLLESE